MELSKNSRTVLVIGGGIAGLTAAKELVQSGISTHLVEKTPFVGGHAANLACKATDRCLKCNDCLVEEQLRGISLDSRINIHLNTKVEEICKEGQKFKIALRSSPRRIDQTACPEEAINLGDKEVFTHLEVDGIVLATGFQPSDPGEIKRYNFPRFKNMVTGMDLEKMLRNEGHIFRPSDGLFPKSLAFVQCVGSRDPQLHRDYCSRVCCGYAIRMALRVSHEHPETRITLFYMDIQNFGKDFDRLYRQLKNEIRLIRSLPGDVYPSENEGIALSYYDGATRKTVSEAFDMVVLSVGIAPPASNVFFRDGLGLVLNEDGFLKIPEGLKQEGIVLAGSAEGPMDVSESITHAKRAALEMVRVLRS